MVYSGEIGDVIQNYLNHSREAAAIKLEDRTNRKGNGNLKINKISILNHQQQSVETVSPGEEFKLVFDYKLNPEFKGANILIRIEVNNSMGIAVFEHTNKYNGIFLNGNEVKENNQFVLSIQHFPFPFGDYFLSFYVFDNGEPLDSVQDAIVFSVNNIPFANNVRNPLMSRGTTLLDGQWSLNEK